MVLPKGVRVHDLVVVTKADANGNTGALTTSSVSPLPTTTTNELIEDWWTKTTIGNHDRNR